MVKLISLYLAYYYGSFLLLLVSEVQIWVCVGCQLLWLIHNLLHKWINFGCFASWKLVVMYSAILFLCVCDVYYMCSGRVVKCLVWSCTLSVMVILLTSASTSRWSAVVCWRMSRVPTKLLPKSWPRPLSCVCDQDEDSFAIVMLKLKSASSSLIIVGLTSDKGIPNPVYYMISL